MQMVAAVLLGFMCTSYVLSFRKSTIFLFASISIFSRYFANILHFFLFSTVLRAAWQAASLSSLYSCCVSLCQVSVIVIVCGLL